MTSHSPAIEVLADPERHRRRSTAEKLAIVQGTYETDAAVSIVARRPGVQASRRPGVQPNQSFTWRKLATQG
jgi:transposase